MVDARHPESRPVPSGAELQSSRRDEYRTSSPTRFVNLEYTGTYQEHPLHAVDPNFSNHTAFIGTRYWTLLFTVRYALGG